MVRGLGADRWYPFCDSSCACEKTSGIIRLLGNRLEVCNECEVLGKIDYKVNEDTVLRPDIVLTCNETNEAYLPKHRKS